MKTVLHRAEDRGVAEHGWLSSRFSFSFAHWYELTRMGFGALRVLNDDRIAPGGGFPMHPHADMEIVTIVEHGTVSHKDDMGNHRTVSAGEVQVMSAGTGVVHAEFNASNSESLELFQVWILPDTTGHQPRYEERRIDASPNAFELLVSGDVADDALHINQNARIFRGTFSAGAADTISIPTGHGAYFFVIEGGIEIADFPLGRRDALGVWEAKECRLVAMEPTAALLFLVPMHTPQS